MQKINTDTNDQQFEVYQKNLNNRDDVETLDSIVSTLKNSLNEYMSSNDDVEEKFDRFYFIKICQNERHYLMMFMMFDILMNHILFNILHHVVHCFEFRFALNLIMNKEKIEELNRLSEDSIKNLPKMKQIAHELVQELMKKSKKA